MEIRPAHPVSKTARDMLALLVFTVLVAGGLLMALGYLIVGHSWNVAATAIDDATGQLKGYTAIIILGVA